MKDKVSTIVLSVCLAVIFVATIFLIGPVSYKFNLPVTLIYSCLMTLLYMFTLADEKRKTMLIKWLLSIPLSFPVWKWFVRCEFMLRCLNWFFPEYGRQSAGGAFAQSFLMLIFMGVCGSGVFICLLTKPKLPEKVKKLQPVISLALTLILWMIVLVLEKNFPSIGEIHS